MAFSTVQYARFFQAALATGTTTQYTTPAARQDVVKDYEICNTTGGALTVSVYIVPSGQSAGTATSILAGASIPANQTFHWTGTIVMNAGDSIATASGGAGLTMTVSGLESQ